jgi:hypothetical protein
MTFSYSNYPGRTYLKLLSRASNGSEEQLLQCFLRLSGEGHKRDPQSQAPADSSEHKGGERQNTDNRRRDLPETQNRDLQTRECKRNRNTIHFQ